MPVNKLQQNSLLGKLVEINMVSCISIKGVFIIYKHTIYVIDI